MHTHPAPDAAAGALDGATSSLVAELLAFLEQGGCSDAEFDALALRLHAWQHDRSAAYRGFCRQRGVALRSVRSWRDIPALPIDAFKELELSCQPPAASDRVFMTSGTTRGDIKGRHRHPTLAVYDCSMTLNFASRFMTGRERLDMAILFPDEEAMPNSSLAHYLELARREFGTRESRHWVGADGLETEPLLDELRAAERRGAPYALLGASYSIVHLLEEMQQRGLAFRLPPGSRLLDTGGFKGRSRAVAIDAFYDALSAAFGVARGDCINMYGMTELSTQFYDAGNAIVPSVKSGPHWIRSRLVDPVSGRDVAPGERGILVHCDLANFNSVTTILTEDVGVAADGGFRLLGRAEGAAAKGCSLAAEELLRMP